MATTGIAQRRATAEPGEYANDRRRDVSVTPFKDFPLADRNRAWDGATAEKRVRAWAKADDDDEPTVDYRNAHVWYDKTKKANFTA